MPPRTYYQLTISANCRNTRIQLFDEVGNCICAVPEFLSINLPQGVYHYRYIPSDEAQLTGAVIQSFYYRVDLHDDIDVVEYFGEREKPLKYYLPAKQACPKCGTVGVVRKEPNGGPVMVCTDCTTRLAFPRGSVILPGDPCDITETFMSAEMQQHVITLGYIPEDFDPGYQEPDDED